MGSFSRGGALCAGMVALWGCGGGDTTGEDAGGGAPGGGSAGSSAASDAGGGHGGRDAAPPPVPGAQRFSRFVVDDAVTGPAFASAADMNGDGRLELIVSAFGRLEGLTQPPGTVTVYLQGADARQWTPLPVITEADGVYFPNEVQPLDLDGDGDLDLILPSGFLVCAFLPGVGACGGLQWFENKGGSFAWHAVVPVGDELFYHAAVVADLDRDGRPELITVAEQRTAPDGSGDRAEIRVFPGLNSPDRFGSDFTVIGNGLGALVSAADLDADGDLDLLSGEFFAGQGASFVWYEQVGPPNAGAPAGSWTRHVVDDTRGPAIQFSRVPDLFGPGVDGFVGANHTNTAKSPPDLQASGVFAYRRPPDPRGPWSGTPISHDIVSVAGSPASPQAAPGIFGWGDADGDGDVDLLVSGDGDPRIYLLEQRAPGLFETLVLDEDMAQAGGMKIVDLDADGRAELLATAYGRNELVLYLPEAEGAHPLGVAAPPHAPAPGEVELRIDYTGALSGNLIVGLFTQWPPAGPPLAFKQIIGVGFPQTVTLSDVAPGHYTALVALDTLPYDPMALGTEDPQLTVELDAPGGAPASVTLTDDGTTLPAINTRTDVTVVLNYGGTMEGQLIVAAFPALPPAGPPASFQIADPPETWPLEVVLPGVAGASCQVYAFLDAAPLNPMFPGPEDPIVESDPLALDGTRARIELTLVDPR